MNQFNFLSSPQMFIEFMCQVPNSSHNNNPTKNTSNFIQTRQKIRTINAIHNSRHTIIKNGRQVGISTLVTFYLLYYALTNTNKSIVIFCNYDLSSYHNLIFQTLNHLNFIHSYNFNYSSKSNSLIEVNSNKIRITNNLNNIIGIGVDVVYLDDFAFCKDANNVVSNFLPIINFTKGKIIISSNPSPTPNMFQRIYKESNHFQKVDFPNTRESFKDRMSVTLDKENYEMVVNAKLYPEDPKNNCKKG